MNERYRRVPATFGPETGFKVEPSPPSPFQARQEAELERLKAQLLAERLAGRWSAPLAYQVQRAANEAAFAAHRG